jgi:4-carboxymuconolactone decarboxylase
MSTEESLERVRAIYLERQGSVPPMIQQRINFAEHVDRGGTLEAVEVLKATLSVGNPLGDQWSQLVHFAQLLALGHTVNARHHARFARKAGATLVELTGIVELTLITAGMPAYIDGVNILCEIFEEEEASADGVTGDG